VWARALTDIENHRMGQAWRVDYSYLPSMGQGKLSIVSRAERYVVIVISYI
jgi:hypothetical protein